MRQIDSAPKKSNQIATLNESMRTKGDFYVARNDYEYGNLTWFWFRARSWSRRREGLRKVPFLTTTSLIWFKIKPRKLIRTSAFNVNLCYWIRLGLRFPSVVEVEFNLRVGLH